jgi:Spy/CpxP family protein refolding chaperone
MRHHRNRCYSPVWGASFGWPYRFAYGTSGGLSGPADPRTPEQDPPQNWYAQREHRRRSRHTGSFGGRRPLRYLSYQLDLDEPQRRQIGAVLEEVKVEREQADLDEKKMVASLAEQIGKPEVTADSLKHTLSSRVRSTEQIQAIIAEALEKIVGILDADQREEFAYLLRTGAFRV